MNQLPLSELSEKVCHSNLVAVDAGLLMGKTIKKVEQCFNAINIQCTDGSIFCFEAFSNCEIACQQIQN